MDSTSDMDSGRLARYVAGEADAAEREAVERWAAASAEHRRELEAMQRVWSLSLESAPAPAPDVDAAWTKLQARIDGRGRVVPLHRRPVLRWLAAAAAVSAVAFLLVVRYQRTGQEWSTGGTYLTAFLADSSSVVLSPGSRIEARMGGKRRVELSGEAYFEVAHDAARPFTVEAGGVEVTVLGTGFEVIAYDTARVVQVRVRHGHVRVQADTGSVDLLAGQEAAYDRSAKRLVRSAVPSSMVWGDRILQFERAPLAQVVESLRRTFHVRIDLADPAIGRCELTASFDNEPIGTILQVVSDTFGMRVEQAGPDHFILHGDGC